MAAMRDPKLSPAQYLIAEREATEKHEYVDGYVYAMAGAKLAHIQICANLVLAVGPELKSRGCQILASDMRVRIPNLSLYTYPDIAIVCAKPELEDPHKDTLLNPLVLFEVLSPSTEAWDRGEKFARYQTIPSLQEYVLVCQDRPRVECFRRRGKKWILSVFEGFDSTARFDSLGLAIRLREIYDRVELEPSTRPTGGIR